MIKREIHIFLTAILFFTRIPCPKWVNHEASILSKSAKYFSLVGIVVGGIGALIYWLSSFILPNEVAILLSIVSTVYCTGAFHEDGFADVCDGFGGGWTKEKILTIMKDSRLGTYGVIGLILILGIKFYTLKSIPNNLIPLVIIAGHSTSRFIATLLLYTHPYVSDTDASKSKPAATNITFNMLVVSGIIASIPLLFFFRWEPFILFVPMYLAKVYLGNKFKTWIGGQTGDCAGAVQQVTEVIFYISFIILWKFI